jgi:hypothetical protein
MDIDRSVIELEKMQRKLDGLRAEKISLENSISESEKKLEEAKRMMFEKYGISDENIEETLREVENKTKNKLETLQKKFESY